MMPASETGALSIRPQGETEVVCKRGSVIVLRKKYDDDHSSRPTVTCRLKQQPEGMDREVTFCLPCHGRGLADFTRASP
jgi:hypothetical protein